MEVVLYFFIAVSGFALGWFLYVQNKDVQVTRHTISFEFLPKEFDGFRIVHLSDLHSKTFGKKQRYLIDAIRSAKPDSIVITGDIVDYLLYKEEPVIDLIEGVRAIAPIYYASGNHEWCRPEFPGLCTQMIERGVHILNDRFETITRGEHMIAIAGIDDVAKHGGEVDRIKTIHKTLAHVRAGIDEQAFKILLVHRPELLPEYVHHHFNLIFAGHAHGGQWNLPVLGPIFAPGQGLFPRLVSGVHNRHNTVMVISRGIGNSGILAFQRLFNKPEVVVIVLKKSI